MDFGSSLIFFFTLYIEVDTGSTEQQGMLKPLEQQRKNMNNVTTVENVAKIIHDFGNETLKAIVESNDFYLQRVEPWELRIYNSLIKLAEDLAEEVKASAASADEREKKLQKRLNTLEQQNRDLDKKLSRIEKLLLKK